MDRRSPAATTRGARHDALAAVALVGAATWLLVRDALRRGPLEATAAVVLVVGGLAAWRNARLRELSRVEPRDDGLALRRGRAPVERIPWASVRSVRWCECDVRGDGGSPARTLCVARVEREYGEPWLVADLGPVRFARVELPDGSTLAHADSPEALVGTIAVRAPGAVVARLDLPSPAAGVPLPEALGVVALADLALRAADALGALAPHERAVAAVESLAPAVLACAAWPALRRARGEARAAQVALIALPGVALAVTLALLATRSRGLAWTALGALALLLPARPLPAASAARRLASRVPRRVLSTGGLALASVLAARGMTVLPLALLAGLAAIELAPELRPDERPRTAEAVAACLATCAAALAARLLVHGSPPSLGGPLRALLE